MPYQNLLGTIPQAIIDSVTTKLNEVATDLNPYLINLSVQERLERYKMGPVRYGLVQKTITVADTYPQVVPPFVVVLEVKNDFTRYGQLVPILAIMKSLTEGVEDTMIASGNEALVYGTKPIYASVKAAREQNVPGADAAYDLLNPYYDLPDQPDGGNP